MRTEPYKNVSLSVPESLLERVAELERTRFITVNLSLLFEHALAEWVTENERNS